ncbi:hypothetical protein BUALT_Bualt09G0017400 [Buddleja alternifolia]|uniref:Putative plant transposon protein domain-containing protein n=1 Tax=Buddleja alternifolia TaxID=168488 RepID=A0AAV6X0W7_9LAMI|nr:hypothetical protein BUALT_Bualt09G0017400 [Buddleja alternifolia]
MENQENNGVQGAEAAANPPRAMRDYAVPTLNGAATNKKPSLEEMLAKFIANAETKMTNQDAKKNPREVKEITLRGKQLEEPYLNIASAKETPVLSPTDEQATEGRTQATGTESIRIESSSNKGKKEVVEMFMAKKRTRTSESSETETFVSDEAKKRYTKHIMKRKCLIEKGLTITEGRIPEIIAKNKWEQLVARPKLAVKSIVKEFYANAPEHKDDKVYVRGVWVRVDSEKINEILNIPDLDDSCTFGNMDNLNTNWLALNKTLCKPGTTLNRRDGGTVLFPSNALNRDLKLLHHFICANLFPTLHLSDVSVERAKLLYVIWTEEPLDVGDVIHDSIMRCATDHKKSLWHPSLNTALCRDVNVKIADNEEELNLEEDFDDRFYRMLHCWTTGCSSTPAISAARRSLNVNDRLALLEQRHNATLDYIQKWFTTLGTHL